MARSDYQAVVAKAEKAVQGVKDPELKRVAFQRVLDDMLAGEHPRPLSKLQSPASKRASPKSGHAKTLVKRGPRGYVEELIADRFFKNPKTLAQVKVELGNRGHHIPATSLSGPLQTMCQRKALRRQRTKDDNKKQSFVYSEW